MSPILKISAALLMLIALGLAVLAFFIAKKPEPVPVVPTPVAQVEAPPPAKAVPPPVTFAVVVAAENLTAGTTLTEKLLTTVEWPVQPANTYIDSQELLGQTLRLDVPPKEAITQNMLVQGLAKHLTAGERAVSVSIDELTGAMQRVQPGDIVDVFFSVKKDSEVTGTQSRLLLPQARVLAYGVESVDGPVSGGKDTDQTKGKSGGATPPARHAMLAVPLAQVNELLLASRQGTVQLVLRSPDDTVSPDIALFQSRNPVLKPKADLSADQRDRLTEPENLAYAGDSLAEFTASEAGADTPTVVGEGRQGGGRTLEVIRAGRSERVPF